MVNEMAVDGTDEEGLAFDPETSDISFGRYKSGTVHVMVPLREGDGVVYGPMAFLSAWFRIRTLCGRILSFEETHAIGAFPDSLICMRCHAKMGEHSDRLFEHPVEY